MIMQPSLDKDVIEIKSSHVMEEDKVKMVDLDKRTCGGGEQEVVAMEEQEEEVALPGFRFHPTDEELVAFYLPRKIDNKSLPIEIIKQIDIYKYDPWDLPKISTTGEKEWYYFCLRGRKYRNSVRPNRVTRSGFWKATGIDRPIQSSMDECIGLKKSLVYYTGSAGRGTKTDWMMHEFRLPSSNKKDTSNPSTQEAEIWTICRIFKRNVSRKKYTQVWREPSHDQIPADSCSKTSIFESDVVDDYKCFAASSIQQGVPNCDNFSEANQVFASQWITPTAQAFSLQPHVANPNASESYRDGNWDHELGRMMEYLMEPSSTYDCRYS